MSGQEATHRLIRGVFADVDDYARLRSLLEGQFEAALRHDGERIGNIGADIVALAEAMDARREERVRLAAELTAARGEDAMPAVFAGLPMALREAVEPAWAALEAAVRECKALNLRNGRLLMSQHELMLRVLDGEADTYVPL